nr:nitrate- and nitrite sensing domain-containing protein [Streptomonospora sp. PA3]
MLPSAAFIALWLAISGYLGWDAFLASATAEASNELSTPAAVSLAAVMDERSQTVAYLERPDETRDQLAQARQLSDKRIRKVFDRFAPYRDYATEDIQQRMAEFEKQYRGIDEIREKVDAGNASRAEVMEDYNRVMTAAADLFDAQSRIGSEAESISAGLSATNTFRVVDHLARADAQLTRSFAGGELTHDDQQRFTRLTSSYHTLLENVSGFLSPEQNRRLERLMAGEEYQRLVEMESRIVDHEPQVVMDPVTGAHSHETTVPMTQQEWESAYVPVKRTLTEIGADEARYAAGVQSDRAAQALTIAAVGSLGVALIGFLAISSAVSTTNSIVRRLGRLRDETDHRANVLLPDLIHRLRQNESVDTAAALPRLTTRQDEIGEVASSFDKAQRLAVDAAVRQSELAHGINRVFLNIAHRSQTLIHRQLRLLDRMEREQEDPAQLTELFKLDHLATRSRRNAENLLILGGESPGRTFHKPMPLVDVLRGAISESGDYTRVDRQQVPRVALKGPAVADVIHLVAELVDNATTFSPPQTPVRLSSEQVPNGVVVEIEDRGLGMPEDEMEAANEMLANPPEFDVMRLNDKMRLGLFVVSRLAHRHEIGVKLRPSPYGGVQAIVLLPSVLISDTAVPETTGEPPRPAGPARETAPATGGAGSDGADTPPAGDVLAGGSPAPEPAEAEAGGAAEPEFTPAGLPRRGSPRASAGAEGADRANAPAPAPAPAPPASPTARSDARSAPGTAAGTPAPPEEAAPESGSHAPLPKRTPQANLAPQLYDNPASPESGTGRPAEDGEDRSARLRRNMAAFQQGTHRGRSEGRRQNTTEKDS